MSEDSDIVVYQSSQESALVLTPVMNLEVAKQRLAEFQSFVKGYLQDGEDYGTIPGTPKPTLYKPGADKLCELYGLSDTYPDERMTRVERWEMDPPLFDYEITCVLISRRNGQVISEGKGSCNSYEGKYRWRPAQRLCPKCGKPAIIKGKEEYGGGWICFARKDGCGAKFVDGDKSIEGQAVGNIPNPDVATLKNTILKMAKKRAKIDAVLGATRSSGIFTQDVEDFPSEAPTVQVGNGGTPERKQPQRKSSAPARAETSLPVDEDAPMKPGGISRKQQKALFASARRYGLNDAELKAKLETEEKVKSSSDMTLDYWKKLMAEFNPEPTGMPASDVGF